MTEKKPSKLSKTRLRGRFLACVQSTGRVGKSMTAQGVIVALKFAGVPFVAVDADAQHRTLYRRYPDEVIRFDATRSIDDFALMIQSLPEVPVILVDFPAQATNFLLGAAKHLQLLDFLEGAQIRPTLFIFMADDETAKESAGDAVRFFGDRADYLLVDNPARFRSQRFRSLAGFKWFLDRNTPILEIPTITSVTMAAWEALERKAERHLSLDAVREMPGLHPLSKMELESVRNRFLVQFEDYAERLIPDPQLIKNKVARQEQPKLGSDGANPLTDAFFDTL
jgi:hypothetical protein